MTGLQRQRLTGYSTEQYPLNEQLYLQSLTEQSSVINGGAQ